MPVILKKGLNPIRVEYVEYAGNEVVILGYKGPKDKAIQWLSKTKAKVVKERVFIPIEAKDGRRDLPQLHRQDHAPRDRHRLPQRPQHRLQRR
ncbi:MAG: hypothetical protein EBR95_10115 [Verrucomicrobia bacterium]|nr:hypothetical protein [Verrucomicrobiota bacterium]